MKKSKLPFKGKKFDQDEWLRESQKWQSTIQLPAAPNLKIDDIWYSEHHGLQYDLDGTERTLTLDGLKNLIALAKQQERELSIKRLEACLMGTYDVVDLDVDPPKHYTTIEEIRDHIKMHIDLARGKKLEE